MEEEISIILADDHPIFRLGLANIINSTPGLNLLAEANNGQEALRWCEVLKPRLLILDLEMPEKNGLYVCKKIKQNKALQTKILVLTFYNDKSLFNEVKMLGADGFLLKEDTFDNITTVIDRIVRKNQFYFEDVVMDKLREAGRMGFHTDETLLKRLTILTKSEIAILKLIANSMTNKEIAENLFVSVKTVENHRHNIVRKLNIALGKNSLLKFGLENSALIKNL